MRVSPLFAILSAILPLSANAQAPRMPQQPPAPHISDAAVGYAHLPAVPITIVVTYNGALTMQALQPVVDALKARGAGDAGAAVTFSGGRVDATLAPAADLSAIVLAIRNTAVPQASIVRITATARYRDCFAAQQQAMTSAVGIARRRAVRAAQLLGVHLGQPLSMIINPGQTRDRNDACLAVVNLPVEPGVQSDGPRAFPSIWVQINMTYAISRR